MSIWKKLLIGLLVLVVVMVAGSAMFISLVDPNEYRGTIADLAEEYTGRKLRIGGDLRIRLLPSPSVEANDVTFANAAWASQPEMVRARRVRAEFALLPLLTGRTVVHRVVAIGPKVLLEIDADGRPNWVFDHEQPATGDEPESDAAEPASGLGIVISEIRVEDGEFDYLDAQAGTRIDADLEELTLGSEKPGGRLQLSMRATYQGLPITLAGRLGAAGAILDNHPVEVDLEGSVEKTRFTVQGAVGKPLEGRNLRLDVALKGPSTKVITDAVGVEVEELGPVDLKARVVEEDGHFQLESIALSARPRNTEASIAGSIKNIVVDLDGQRAQEKPAKVDIKGTLGEANLAVAGEVGRPLEAKDLRLNVRLDTKTTRPLTELAGIDVEELGPVDLRLTVIEKGGRLDLEAMEISARPRDADITVKGSVADVIGNVRPDLRIALSAKSLRQLDKTLPDAGPVSLSADARPTGKVIEIRNLVARVGKSDLSGRATVDISGDRPRASAKLRAKVIDLAELVPAARDAEPAPEAKQTKTEVEPTSVRDKAGDGAPTPKSTGRKVFSDAPLPLDTLKQVDGDIALTVDRLITQKVTLENVDLAAKLAGGNLSVKPAARVAGGTVRGTINVDARTRPAKFTADVGASKVSIGTLTKAVRGYELSKGLDSELAMKLRGQGDSVRDLMGGLDGDIRLEIGEGRLNNAMLDRVGADMLSQIVDVAIPTDEKEKTTAVNCAVVRFAIEKGGAVADQTLVLQTEKVLVKGGGLIDLKTEGVDLGADVEAREGTRIGAGTLSSMMRVRGTLAEPQIGTDLTGMAKTGARVGIAVATGGLSLLAESVYGHVSEDKDPCQTALARQIELTPREYQEKKAAGKE